ncbi:MAG: YjbQ family protein [Oscillospiraceae bacterium]|nr:YjbQ family protein [Oscillospiraceae bacterium]MBR0392486.1 YjbQ family protein [Oscillospiraceae bacterium]
MVKITEQVKRFAEGSGIKNGIVFVITLHTTTGITINESLPCVEKDIEEQLERLIPSDYPFNHNHYLPSYGTIGGNTPGHLKSLLTGNHCVLPLVDGKVVLGSAADLYFCEFDGIKRRRYLVYVMGE